MSVDEPLNKCAGITGDDFAPFLVAHENLLLDDSVRGISCCAVDTDTNEVVGGFFFVDLCDDNNIPEDLWSDSKFRCVEEAMACIHTQYESKRFSESNPLKRGVTLKILVRAVLPEYRQRSLASQAMDRAILLAKERNYKYLVSETSSYYTRRSFLRRGGESFGSINYATWTDSKGLIPFASASKPHDGLHLMELQL